MMIVLGIIGLLLVYAAAYALCRAAGDADRQAERELARYLERKNHEYA